VSIAARSGQAFLQARHADEYQADLTTVVQVAELLGRDVLYQLAIYALSQPPDITATILYPTATPGASDAQVEISEPVYGRARAHVIARPVQLDRLEPLLLENSAPSAARARAAYARWLVFGESGAA